MTTQNESILSDPSLQWYSPFFSAQQQSSNGYESAGAYTAMANPLHAYPSYTYSLSLQLVTTEQWNELSTSGKYTAKNVLIASAGRYDNYSFIRNPFFDDDFYFEELKFTSVIGTTSANTGSNDLEFHFTIVEPYGVTLLDRLIDACGAIGEHSHTDSTYLLQIDFFGSDDAGNIVNPIPNMTKYLPLSISEMKIAVTVKGSSYEFKGLPASHIAYKQSSQQTPAHFEVTADTVGNFFKSTDSATSGGGGSTNQRTADSGTSDQVISGYGEGSKYKTKSYANAINAWFASLKTQNDVEVPDTIDFMFDDEIASAKLVEDGKLPPSDVPMVDQKDRQTIIKGDVTKLAADLNPNIRIYPINTGSTVESVLTYVIKNSSFIRNQVNNPAASSGDITKFLQTKQNNEPFWWFKITPQVILLGYDNIRKRRGRAVTYYVTKYAMRNLKLDCGPSAKASSPLKVYNYIYTGKNSDIIDIDIKFNSMFYTTATANANKLEIGSGIENPMVSTVKALFSSLVDTLGTSVGVGGSGGPSLLMPNIIRPIVGDQQIQATGGAISTEAVLAGDLVRSILTEASREMMSLVLKIVGDPHFIKQDDCFYPPQVNGPISVLTENGSIFTDNGEVYVQVTFNAPVDLDESTAPQMKLNPRYNTSTFSGLYRVQTVVNEFSNGKFTQTLTMVRLSNQTTSDYTSPNTTDSSAQQRNPDLTTIPVTTQTIPLANNYGLPPIPTQAAADAQTAVIQSAMSGIPAPAYIGLDVTSPATQQTVNNFASINATAPTVPITQQNQPIFVAPPAP